MCASSDTGVCVIVEFEDVMLNRVNIKQYRVTSKGGHQIRNPIHSAPLSITMIQLSIINGYSAFRLRWALLRRRGAHWMLYACVMSIKFSISLSHGL